MPAKRVDKKITNTTVLKEERKPTDKPREVRDSELKGLILRIQPPSRKTSQATMTYYFQYARGKRIKIGSANVLSPEQARDTAKRIEAQHRVTGKDPIQEKKRAKAENYLNYLETEYQPYLKAHLRNGVDNDTNVRETMANLIRRFPEFHALALNEITSQLIDKWKQRRMKEGVSPATINRQMNDLRACLNKAIEWDMLAANPCDKVEPCKNDSSPKVRYLTPDEENALRQALDEREAVMKERRGSANEWRADRDHEQLPALSDNEFADHLKPAVLLSLNTGVRQGELLKLTWKHVDFDRRTITVAGATTKNAKTRHIKLNAEALSVLTIWKGQAGEQPVSSLYVFCDRNGQPFDDMRTSWEGLLNRAKIQDFRWHDLRHTFASKLVIAGVDLNKVRALLGHSDYKMTLRYAHLAPDHMQDAVDRLLPTSAAN